MKILSEFYLAVKVYGHHCKIMLDIIFEDIAKKEFAGVPPLYLSIPQIYVYTIFIILNEEWCRIFFESLIYDVFTGIVALKTIQKKRMKRLMKRLMKRRPRKRSRGSDWALELMSVDQHCHNSCKLFVFKRCFIFMLMMMSL